MTRLSEQAFRWTAADPNLRWLTENASGLNVGIEDISESVAALALQGPTSARLLQQVCDADLSTLKYFRATSGHIAGVPVDVSRTGYTGDLGYEIWMPWDSALRVWDAIVVGGPRIRSASDRHAGARHRAHRGRAAADRRRLSQQPQGADRVAEVLAATSSVSARLVDLKKGPFIGRAALAEEVKRGIARQIVGLEVDWTEVEKLYEAVGLPPTAPAATSRVAVPVYKGRTQIGRATSTTWSSTLKKLIALATIDAPHYAIGTTRGNGNDGGSGSSPRHRHRCADAVLQSQTEDRIPFDHHRDLRSEIVSVPAWPCARR